MYSTSKKMFSANSLILHANKETAPEVEIKRAENANGGENTNTRGEGYSDRNDKLKDEMQMQIVLLEKGGEELVGFDLEVDDLPMLSDAVGEKKSALAVSLLEGQEARKMYSTNKKDFSANSIQQVAPEDAPEVEIKSAKKENGGKSRNTIDEGYNDINMWMRLFGPHINKRS